MKKSILIYILSIVFAFGVQAQESTNYNKYFHFGGYLHYLMNTHSAEFSTLSDCKSCNPGFSGGFGNGFAFGGLIEFPLNQNNLTLGLRLGYSMRNSDFFQEEKIGNAISKGINAPNVTDIRVEHSLLANLATLDIEPNINYTIWQNLRLSLGLKGAMLLSKTFSQKETIISPSDIVFDDTKTIERNKYTDMEISNASPFLTFLVPAISYDFRFGNGFAISPEARFELPIYDMVDVGWKPMAFNFGVAVRMPYIPKKGTRINEIINSDTITVQGNEILAHDVIEFISSDTVETMEKTEESFIYNRNITQHYKRILPKEDNAVPNTSLTIYPVDNFGNRINASGAVQVIIEEIETEESFPLLPQIFFPQNSSDLSETRMNMLSSSAVSAFDEQELEWNTMDIYYNLLNIIGYRMTKEANAKLEIIGCNNGIDEEKNNTALSKARAEVVRDYLKNTWGIAGNRLIVKSRNLPEKASNNATEDGNEENRRVDLFSSNSKILKPVTLSEIHKTANPPTLRILTSVESDRPLEEAMLEIEQNGTEIRKYLLMKDNEQVDWEVESKPIPTLEEPVNIHLTAKGKNGKVGKTTKSVNIEQRTIKKKKFEMLDDKRVERYSLILFNFNTTNITEQHRESIKMVNSRISPESKVQIIGYTDRIGNPEYNMQLSRDRASNVAKLVNSKAENITIIGNGGEVFPYDNNLPEGRSYNRTVRITVETPIEHK